jgi:hypothetical protein
MTIWKFVDLDPEEVQRLKNRYLRALPVLPYFFQTLDLGITEFMGRPVYKTVLISVKENSVGTIHKDHRPHDNNVLAINIPLINCDNTVTQFWDTEEEPDSIVRYSVSGSPYIGVDQTKCTLIDKFILTRPVVFRTDVLHSVNNHSNRPRLAISLRLVNDPWDLLTTQ